MSSLHAPQFSLTGPILQPHSGIVERIVMLFHGYGSNGDDLIELSRAWQPQLSNTLFLAPHGLTPCKLNGFGYEWFDLSSFDPQFLRDGIHNTQKSINTYIEEVLTFYHLTPDNLALTGFSQGAMLALHTGLHKTPKCAGILAYSGILIDDKDIINPAPLCRLVHGMLDDVVPFHFLAAAKQTLLQNHVAVETFPLSHLGHGINMEGIRLGLEFFYQIWNIKHA